MIYEFSIAADTYAGQIYPQTLSEELELQVAGFRRFTSNGDILQVDSDDDPSAIIASHGDLATRKVTKRKQIDIRTVELISQGFTFDSKQFSLSIPAQINWSSIRENKLDYSWPVRITTIDDENYYLSLLDVDSFWIAARDEVQSHYDSGAELKEQVGLATTIEEVEAVEDDR